MKSTRISSGDWLVVYWRLFRYEICELNFERFGLFIHAGESVEIRRLLYRLYLRLFLFFSNAVRFLLILLCIFLFFLFLFLLLCLVNSTVNTTIDQEDGEAEEEEVQSSEEQKEKGTE